MSPSSVNLSPQRLALRTSIPLLGTKHLTLAPPRVVPSTQSLQRRRALSARCDVPSAWRFVLAPGTQCLLLSTTCLVPGGGFHELSTGPGDQRLS
jgi:hypothetical protein